MQNPDALEKWPEFMEAVKARMERGRKEYGDQSFTLQPPELALEIEEELIDVCGWAFILWSRLRRIDWSKAQPCLTIGDKFENEPETSKKAFIQESPT